MSDVVHRFLAGHQWPLRFFILFLLALSPAVFGQLRGGEEVNQRLSTVTPTNSSASTSLKPSPTANLRARAAHEPAEVWAPLAPESMGGRGALRAQSGNRSEPSQPNESQNMQSTPPEGPTTGPAVVLPSSGLHPSPSSRGNIRPSPSPRAQPQTNTQQPEQQLQQQSQIQQPQLQQQMQDHPAYRQDPAQPSEGALAGVSHGSTRTVAPTGVEDTQSANAHLASMVSAMSEGAVILTDETFDSFVQSEPFALVLFYAPWCHWSRAALPEFDAVARFMAKVASRPIVLGKVDCADNPLTQKKEHIIEYPIIKLYIDGKPKQYVGGRRRTQIFAWLNHNLQRDERLDTLPHFEEFMRNGADGHQLVVAVTTSSNTGGNGSVAVERKTGLSTRGASLGSGLPCTSIYLTPSYACLLILGDSSLFDHETFRHVARTFSDDVLFGEIHEPVIFQYFLHQYILPKSKTSAEMWQPPFVVTAPLDPSDPPFVKYLGQGDDRKALEGFVHKYRFPQVLAFEPDTIEDIFEDGRSICILLLDGDRAARSLTREGLVDPVVAAFHQVAGEFRQNLIFTISGNKEAHERRIFSLLGVDDTITSPEFRIATFNPSGNGKYYPAEKYKPSTPLNSRSQSTNISVEKDNSSSTTDKANRPAYSFRNTSPTHSLIVNALSTSAKARNSLRSSKKSGEGPPETPHGLRHETVFDAQQRQDQGAAEEYIRNFVWAFIEGDLEPYTNSEPIPPVSQNSGPVKTFVGLNFQKEVLDSPHDVFVSFGAPWCGHCRKLEPAFKRVAKIVSKRSSLVLGRIDATLNEIDGINLSEKHKPPSKSFAAVCFNSCAACFQFFIDLPLYLLDSCLLGVLCAGYPTLLLFRAGSKNQPLMYEGDRSESDMLFWLGRNAQHSKLDGRQLQEDLGLLLTEESGTQSARRANTSVLEEL
ncbi:uncharacterized protein LOC34618526 [Cyclospora cayetanensis]|uniref:Uncharacterized protein LOC34618526 n=1 Tax=Cyclospora cayetanensis TaxID=88456 RepID=A0A6P6RYZ9_9EIME|nr:uncharacterized protein LOC34618526 [Cyclospora cayetanensis]